MPRKQTALVPQIVAGKNKNALIRFNESFPDSISWWMRQYFQFEVTTAASSRKVQGRDLQSFLDFMFREERSDKRVAWSPRLSKSFQDYLRAVKIDGKRRWNDRTVNRVMAHLKTFSKWVHKIRPFPLGDPMLKITLQAVGTGLDVERALTASERRKMLDAADLLLEMGGRSKDRSRFRNAERPMHKTYRPYRNRAIVYTLIETGMRRAAITHLDLIGVDWKKRTVSVLEKGGVTHNYSISREGLEAIKAYVESERAQDAKQLQQKRQSLQSPQSSQALPALFLTAHQNPRGGARLSVRSVNVIWDEVGRRARVEGKTPHSARHAMGKHIIEKTGNIAAVQRQLGHKNVAYSMQYSRITADELSDVINDR